MSGNQVHPDGDITIEQQGAVLLIGTGGGRFKSVMKSETDLECTWDGNYELAKSQAA
jgi:hypothetical protein